MKVKKVIIENFKGISSSEVDFQEGVNLLVGANEVGKSTVLDAIYLALTCRLNDRSVYYDLHPFLFNQHSVAAYFDSLRAKEAVAPPEVCIEVYLEDDPELVRYRGSNNSLREDVPGLLLRIKPSEDFADEFGEYVSDPDHLHVLPVEYYEVEWMSFAGDILTPRSKPLKVSKIDAAEVRSNSGPNKYVLGRASEHLSSVDRAKVAVSYRNLKADFVKNPTIEKINKSLAANKGVISGKVVSIDLDSTSRGSWESGVITKIDDVPFELAGKGEQNSVKILLALNEAAQSDLVLVEEPENHQAPGNLRRLIDHLSEKSKGRQVFVSTHSSFVMNKMGVENVIMLGGEKPVTLNTLSPDTRDYFMRLPGSETLRFVLAAGKVFLVEGPSDSLVVQRAYYQKYGRQVGDDGIEVIEVRSLAFKRFLEISILLGIESHVFTDNDGDLDKISSKYEDYSEFENIFVHYSDNVEYKTLEPQMVFVNSREDLCNVLGKEFDSDDDLLDYMKSNKTDWALKVFESDEGINFPKYIYDNI